MYADRLCSQDKCGSDKQEDKYAQHVCLCAVFVPYVFVCMYIDGHNDTTYSCKHQVCRWCARDVGYMRRIPYAVLEIVDDSELVIRVRTGDRTRKLLKKSRHLYSMWYEFRPILSKFN